MKNGGLILWNAIVLSEIFKTSGQKGKTTTYERRFGEPFKGLVIPFGAMVEDQSISGKDQSRRHQFGKVVLCGIFLGYALFAVGFWKGGILVADIA